MASIIFIYWLLFVVALLILNFGNVVLFMFIRERIRRRSIEGEDIGFLILGIVCMVAGIVLYNIAPDKKTQLKMFYESKPTCKEETVKCLSSKAKWYRDSIEYKVKPLKENNQALIDSLKNIVNQYEK
jgi:hypothetical protein